tara:strand:- start:135 stop:653 length:519 start_codon:yes stop_codon:yes gene_type:complete
MKSKTLPITLILIFSLVFFIFYKSLQNTNIYTPGIKKEIAVPKFSANKFGTTSKINSNEIFKEKKFYLMNIWASWCIPCKEEHPYLMELKESDNLVIVGLNYKDRNENAKKFLNKLKNPYEIELTDQEGIISIEWGAYGVPESFLIYENKIIKKIVGPISQTSFNEIKDLIK